MNALPGSVPDAVQLSRPLDESGDAAYSQGNKGAMRSPHGMKRGHIANRQILTRKRAWNPGVGRHDASRRKGRSIRTESSAPGHVVTLDGYRVHHWKLQFDAAGQPRAEGCTASDRTRAIFAEDCSRDGKYVVTGSRAIRIFRTDPNSGSYGASLYKFEMPDAASWSAASPSVRAMAATNSSQSAAMELRRSGTGILMTKPARQLKH